MVAIRYPIPCNACGDLMENYHIDTTTKKIIFKCGCGCIDAVTEDEYFEKLKESNRQD